MHVPLRSLIATAFLLLVTAGSASPAAISVREVTFRTADGWTIHADYVATPEPMRAVILLHQRRGSGADWKPLVPRLNAAGIATLALDLRGAGRSRGPRNGARAPWDASKDIAAALTWLGRHGFSWTTIGLVGAGYGATNALVFATTHPRTPVVALLSPGDGYGRVRLGSAGARYRGPLLVASSARDAAAVRSFVARLARGPREDLSYAGSARGTALLRARPDLVETLSDFMARHLPCTCSPPR